MGGGGCSAADFVLASMRGLGNGGEEKGKGEGGRRVERGGRAYRVSKFFE